MRCIETLLLSNCKLCEFPINYNMRCIETDIVNNYDSICLG